VPVRRHSPLPARSNDEDAFTRVREYADRNRIDLVKPVLLESANGGGTWMTVRYKTVVMVLTVTVTASGCASAVDGPLTSAPCEKPRVAHAAIMQNSTNVLSVFVTATAQQADSVIVRFGVNAVIDSATPAFVARGDSAFVPLLGLLPSSSYEAQLIAFNSCGASASELMTFATGALPSDLPVYATLGTAASPGFVVFAAASYGLVIDNSGRVVWYHRFPNGPGLNFQAQPDGRYAARPPASAGEIGSWVEIGVGGDVARTLGCAHGFPSRMHDMIAEPDGSYWLLCDETRTMDLSAQEESSQARVLGTNVQHRGVNGDSLFEWSPFDHFQVDVSILQTADRKMPVINWTHGNALDLDRDGNLLVSFRNLSEVTKIDTRTGGVLWRLGGQKNQFTFEDAPAPVFLGQHGVRATAAGELTLLDNLGQAAGSRAERYVVDDVHRIARLSARFAGPAGLVGQIGGSTQSLSDGHTLVSFGSGNAVQEYDAHGNVAWKIVGNSGYIFRAQRVRSLYRPGVGDPR
jgi:hypothetical protein